MRKLTPNDIYQGDNSSKDNSAHDLLTWIDKLWPLNEHRILVQRAIALKLGIFSHSLLRWADTVSKEVVANTFNEVVAQLIKENKDVPVPQ